MDVGHPAVGVGRDPDESGVRTLDPGERFGRNGKNSQAEADGVEEDSTMVSLLKNGKQSRRKLLRNRRKGRKRKRVWVQKWMKKQKWSLPNWRGKKL